MRIDMTGKELDEILKDARERLNLKDHYPVDWFAFPETWASTALGFGGLGGASITIAQTVIVKRGSTNLLYWSGRFVRNITTEQTKEYLAHGRSSS